MDFSKCTCTVERELNIAQLVDKIQSRMLGYPVAVVITGGDNEIRHEFATWLGIKIGLDDLQYHWLQNSKDVECFSGEPSNTCRVNIVSMSGEIGEGRDNRYKSIVECRKVCKQVMLVWLQPSLKIEHSEAEPKLDQGMIAGKPTSTEADYLTTVYY